MKRPLIVAHGKSSHHGRENSVEFVRNIAPFHPDIIELDIRRSRDGVLFCYHGSIPFGVFLAQFLCAFSFAFIRKYWRVDTLPEVLAAISGRPALYLDLKQANIAPLELDRVLRKFKLKPVIFQTYSLVQLRSLQKAWGQKYRYVYNWGIGSFRTAFKKVREYGVFGSHIFWWQCSPQNIQKLKNAGLEYWIFPYLISRQKYLALSKKWNALAVAYDNLDECVEK